MYEYLLDNGMSRQEYRWFREHGRQLRPHCILGSDYDVTNEYRVLGDAAEGGGTLSGRGPDSVRGPFKVPALSGEVEGDGHRGTDLEGTSPAGEVLGYYVICHQYFDRYHLPVMHTETNRKDADAAPAWLWGRSGRTSFASSTTACRSSASRGSA